MRLIYKHYKTINFIILGFAIYILFLPFVAEASRTIHPELWNCAYRSITGNPCPFCGLTTDIRSISTGIGDGNIGANINNPLSKFIYPVVLLQIFFRAIIIIMEKRIVKLKQVIAIDTVLQLSIVCLFLAWAIKRFMDISI